MASPSERNVNGCRSMRFPPSADVTEPPLSPRDSFRYASTTSTCGELIELPCAVACKRLEGNRDSVARRDGFSKGSGSSHPERPEASGLVVTTICRIGGKSPPNGRFETLGWRARISAFAGIVGCDEAAGYTILVTPHKLRAPATGGRSVRNTRVIVTHYGGPDALRVVEEECPEPKDGEVRVRVLAAGVSLPDIMAREGVHPETPATLHAGVGSGRRGGSARRRYLWNRTRPDSCRDADPRRVRGVRLPAAT